MSSHLHSLRLLALASVLALLPSCAYMQTHKNVLEKGQSYKGHKLDKPRELFRSGNTWYVAATPAEYRLRYDFVHDNVFRKSHEPTMQLETLLADSPSFHAISADTAAVLLRSDGYADNATLAREVKESASPWLVSLPSASAHPVKAMVAGEDSVAITSSPAPEEVPFGYQVLSGLDLVFVDAPGTLLYNVAVPFIAPFVFFSEFLEEQY